MAKQLNVNLNIDAQTSKAKQALTELNKILTDIQTNRTITINDKSLEEAKQAASDLKFHLSQATSVNTGKLNLGTFSQSLKKAGQDLNTLYNKLSTIGPEGQKAFLALSQSIVQADHASLTLGNRLSQLGTTLANTARWQISSSILHGFMGALQSAYGYAQDLNQSLNNIRIVTGYTTDQMAQFAEQANKAAKALSTSTTSYTDAALIYYQQGLSGKAVTDRVETTIKLANVSRQSAEEVSSQMTAIWNNFADGSKNLEYYADVITKLGAATAASSSEISDGIQKFAAVADTVGLSYEKATAALATVVAETRQSADVVGTAFKTMFARFQGLQLGETLEDGVTLNKYSEAINTVGVNILKANGDLKDMDTILDELGEKWNSIGQAQKVALAETVAGTRQYAQFMAIMENYDKILANQDLAAGAEGTLQEQADIYAESWEAASKRVRAAAQGIYQDLINDKAFITALNTLEKIISTVDGAIKGFGGLKTILLAIGSIVATKYANEMPAILQKLVGNFNVLTGAAEKNRLQMIQDANAIIQKMNAADAGTKGFQAEIGAMQLVSKMTTELEQKKHSLSKAEIENYELKIKEVQLYGQAAVAIGQEIDALERLKNEQQQKMRSTLYSKGNLGKVYSEDEQSQIKEAEQAFLKQKKAVADWQKELAKMKQDNPDYAETVSVLDDATAKMGQLENKLKDLKQNLGFTGSQLIKDFSEAAEKAGKMSAAYDEVTNKTKTWQQALKSTNPDLESIKGEVAEYVKSMEQAGFNMDKFKEQLNQAGSATELSDLLSILIDKDKEFAYQTYAADDAVENIKSDLLTIGASQGDLDALEQTMRKFGVNSQQSAAAIEQLKKKYLGLQPHVISLSEAFTRLGGAAMALSSALNAIKNIGQIWHDENLSKGEKFLQILTSVGMLLPALNTLLDANTLKTLASSFSTQGLTAAMAAYKATTDSATTSTVAFSTVLKALPFGWILVALGAIVAAIVLIAKAIETPTEKLERLKKSVQELKDECDEAKKRAENLKSTFDSYDSVLKTLESCTKGTIEWNNALEKVRKSTLDIIEQYPELVSDMKFEYINGVRIISNLDQIQKKAQQAANRLQLITLNADMRIAKQQNNINIDKTKEKYAKISSNEKLVNAVFDSVDYYGDAAFGFERLLNDLGDALPIADLKNLSIELQSLSQEAQKLDNAFNETSISIANSLLSNTNFTEKVDEYGLSDFSNQLGNTISVAAKNANEDYYNKAKQHISSEDKEAVLNEYLKLQGLSGTFAGISEGKFRYRDSQGEIQTKSIDAVEEAVASNRALSYVEQNIIPQITENVLNSFSTGLQNFSSNNRDLLTNLLSGQLSQIDVEQFKRLSLTENDAKVFAELYNLLNGTNFNASNIEDYIKSIITLGDCYRAQIKDVGEIQQSIQDLDKAFGSLKIGDTVESLDGLSDGMESYFIMMADGTYKLIGYAEEFQEALFEQKAQQYKDNISVTQKYLNNIEDQLTDEEKWYTNMVRGVGQIGMGQYLKRDENGNFQIIDEASIHKTYEDSVMGYAMLASSLKQLDKVKGDYLSLGVDELTQTKALSASLQNIAQKYDTCTDDLKAYQTALQDNNKELIQATEQNLKFSIAIAQVAENSGFDKQQTEDYAKRLKNYIAKDLDGKNFSNEQIEQITIASALANQKLDRGLDSLNSQLETYKKNLIDVNKNSFDWSNQMQAFKTDLADILDMDVSTITDEFAESLLTDADKADIFAKALKGDVDALDDLQEKAADEIFLSSNIEDVANHFVDETTTMGDLWEYFKEYVGATLEAGDLDQSKLIDAFTQLINVGKYTREQIIGMLSGLHITAQLVFDPVTQTWSLKTTDHSVGLAGPGASFQEWIASMAPNQDKYAGFTYDQLKVHDLLPEDPLEGLNEILDTKQRLIEQVAIRAFEPEIKSHYKEPDETDDDDDDGTKGPEHHYKEKLLKEEQHRYEDIRNELAALQTSYERVAKAEELLYGKEKFDSMRKRLKMLEDEEKVARKLLEANLGKNWEYYYNKVKNGEAITKDDIANAGGYLGGDWDELTGQKGIAIQYQQTENGNEINKSENINIGAIFEAAGIKWDPKIIDGFFENPEKIEDNITKLEQKLYAGIDRTQEGYEEKEARIAAIIQAIRDVYASTTTELQNMNEMIDENIEYEHKRQAIIDAFPKKHLELITDELHRYDELNKTLEELNRQYEDLGKARERAWGKNKIQLLDQELKKLEQLQGTYEEYLETIFGENWKDVVKALQSGSSVGSLLQSGIIGGTLSQDRQRLIGKQGNTFDYIFTDDQGHDQRYQEELDLEGLLGFAIEFDASGNITNLDKIMSRFDEIENERKTKYDNETGIFQGENQYLDQQEAEKEKRRIEVAKERLEQYQDTITAGIDNYEKWLDNQYEQQAKFYENFRYKIDLKIEISERSLKRIEYAIKVLGDNIYKVPEIMQSWFDKRVGETMGEVTSQAGTWAQAFTDAQAAYAAGDISQEDYVQTIKDAQDGLYGCIDALLEINEEMREYYKNVLSRVKEEMSRITNEMDHQLDTVQHLTNVLSLLGRDTDYEAIGKILDAQLKMNENGYNVSKAQVEMYRDQVAKAEATLQELIMEGVSEDAQNEWKNAVLYPAKEALLEAEKEMQADFEAYLKTVNAIYENKINQIYQDSERRLAGLYGSFDELNNAMERQRALDDEYLTKTNQIYETNVLIKKIAKDIDKTNNDSAKLKLKNFSAEIDGLQQKNKLSKSELDIAKARYEVLQAEIALEDARNAKSTVRLQRDNEGNYGYVYTADADNIAAAEDAVEGKRNDLYNLVLGQANNYTEKIIQLTQERNAALKQLDLDYAEGRIADEDTYNRLKEDIVNKYNSLIEEDYESYYRALYWLDQTAVTDHTEAWGTGFQDILDAGEDFQSETDQLMQETGSAIDWLNEIRDRATEEAKVGNGELEQQLKDLTDQNDALAKKMQEEVIPQAGETLTKAQELTAEWARQYEEIMRLIDAYLALIDAMQKVLLEMSGLDENIEDEFDMTKDYSREATEAFKNSGNQVTLEVIQALLDRQTKEEKLGGHNENYFTNEQLLELFMKAQETKDEALLSFIEDILSNNATYTVDRLKELGISEAGYSLDAAKESVDFAAQAQDEANDLTKEAVQAQVDNKDATKDSAEQIENATEDNADKNETTATELAENTQQTAEELANTTQETEEALVNSEQELMDQEQDLMEDTTNEIEGTTENLISALDRNANIVSSAVQMAAQTMAYSIMQAKTAELNAENAARRAEAAAASISGATGLASGGYTGAWGSHGKIAILHEKELVLNATDTENLLSAISLLRDFSSAIDLRAAENSISGGLNSPYYGGNAQSLEQEVTIHAEFPGVTNHNEIEEAFNNLVNRASQYAHRY